MQSHLGQIINAGGTIKPAESSTAVKAATTIKSALLIPARAAPEIMAKAQFRPSSLVPPNVP